MRYSITFLARTYHKLIDHLRSDTSVEQGAYILCRLSRGEYETRLLARDVIPISQNELLSHGSDHLSISSESYARVFKQAADDGLSFVFAHSHPEGYNDFSSKDDAEEKRLFQAAYNRIDGGVHASMVFPLSTEPCARVWTEEGLTIPIGRIRIVGEEYKIFAPSNAQTTDPFINIKFFDRQVRAFGKDLQVLLGQLHIGVVGCGGTGSAVIEQLIRLGVGEITVIDHDKIEDTNVSRIHGSKLADADRYKVDAMKDMADQIGFGTKVHPISKQVTKRTAAMSLRDCDLVFGCTDDESGRGVLALLCTWYLIPFIDMGVRLYAGDDHVLRNVPGRVTINIPGKPCLFCRGRISPEGIAAEQMPEEMRQIRVREGYCPELAQKDPAVINFTTAVASLAVSEMLNLLTGFMGCEFVSEYMWIFDLHKIQKREEPQFKPGCFCCSPDLLGKGDAKDFLGMTWPPEPQF